jgi:hypothetical protein
LVVYRICGVNVGVLVGMPMCLLLQWFHMVQHVSSAIFALSCSWEVLYIQPYFITCWQLRTGSMLLDGVPKMYCFSSFRFSSEFIE